jgi:Tol biopolymer transport system component
MFDPRRRGARRRLSTAAGAAALAGACACTALPGIAAADTGVPGPPGRIDNRGWELVSPADGNGAFVQGARLSADGNRIGVTFLGGVPGAASGGRSVLIGDRSPTGWTFTDIVQRTPRVSDSFFAPMVTTPDLSTVAMTITQSFLGSGQAEPKLARIRAGAPQALLHTFEATNQGIVGVVGSEDTSRIFDDTYDQLDPAHQLGTLNVYDFGSGTPQIVSVLPDGSVPQCGTSPNGAQQFASPVDTSLETHINSRDGSRVFFHSAGNSCGDPAELYMRDLAAGTTTLVSGPPASGAATGAQFLQATPDGDRVFFQTSTALVGDDGNGTSDVYRYTVGSGNECLTCGVGNVNFGVASEDGSTLYFTSPEQYRGEGDGGVQNLYMVRDGATSYIAPSDGLNRPSSFFGNPSAEVSFAGDVILFRSFQARLDGSSGSENGGFNQYYRYDVVDRSITCISCPDGRPATADVPASLVTGDAFTDVNSQHAMSADGDIIAFITDDRLADADVNQGSDIYEWHNGQRGLITNGVKRPSPQYNQHQVRAVSPDGRNILFATHTKLTPEVIQGDKPWMHIYVARVDGGFRTPTEPAPCTGEQCQGPVTTPPVLPPVGSAQIDGPGDEDERPAPKLVVNSISKRQLTRFARTGRLTVSATTNVAGKVSASAKAKIGKRTRTVASASRSLRAAGSAKLTLKLSTAARRQLRRSGKLTVSLTVSAGEAGKKTYRLSLKKATRRARKSAVHSTADGR